MILFLKEILLLNSNNYNNHNSINNIKWAKIRVKKKDFKVKPLLLEVTKIPIKILIKMLKDKKFKKLYKKARVFLILL